MNRKIKILLISLGIIILVLAGYFIFASLKGDAGVSADEVVSESVSNPSVINIDNGLQEVIIGQQVDYNINLNMSELLMNVSKLYGDEKKNSKSEAQLLNEIRDKIKNGNLYLAGVVGNVASGNDNAKIEKTGNKFNTRLWMSDGVDLTQGITYNVKTTVPRFESDGSKNYYSKIGLYYRSSSSSGFSFSSLAKGVFGLSDLFSGSKSKMIPISVVEHFTPIAQADYRTADLWLSRVDVVNIKSNTGNSGAKSPQYGTALKVVVANLGKYSAKDTHITLSSAAEVFDFVPSDTIVASEVCETSKDISSCKSSVDMNIGELKSGGFQVYYFPIKFVSSPNVKYSDVVAQISTADNTVTDPSNNNNFFTTHVRAGN
ncbi:MAG: hypothetical protein BWY19_00420 [bacterium ADurb.Bin212]|nr:MAG: hypothetical protein BWY19_00420 [bacterium ADurb.Bin212]